MNLEDVERFLPIYLYEPNRKRLFEQLKAFPEDPGQLFTGTLLNDKFLYQGDGYKDFDFSWHLGEQPRAIPAMVVSNSCDVDPRNRRVQQHRLVYCPILKLGNIEKAWLQGVDTGNIDSTEEGVRSFVQDIKNQRVTNAFFLSSNAVNGLEEDSVAFFDHVINNSLSSLHPEDIPERRLFTLSDFGFWLFIFKLSIHFTRIRENINRGG